MWATGFYPEPWDPAAVILVGRLLSFGGLAISQLQHERLIVELVHAGANPAALTELLHPRLDHVDFDLMRQVKMSNRLSNEALQLLVDLPRLSGSNAWAVAPQRSASGSALLASDPHLEVNRLPAIWYEAVLGWDGSYVMGATLPGFPLFSTGRTPRLGWGTTYMKADTIDFFIEHVQFAEGTGWQYQRNDVWHDFVLRREILHGKGAEPVPLVFYENDVGVLDGDPNQHGPGYYLSIAWVGRHISTQTAISVWLDLIHAQSTSQAMDLVAACTQPTLCFVFADSEGHIGKQGCGLIPARRWPAGGLAAVPAWERQNHWQGWLPQRLHTAVYDPPEGFAATANEEQNVPGEPMLVTQVVNDYRLRRIVQRLQQLPCANLQDMRQIQYDVVSVQAEDLLRLVLPHLPEGPLKQRLASWDCGYQPTSTTAAVFQQLYRNLIVELLGHEQGIGWLRMLFLCSRAGYSSMMMSAADRLWQKQDSWWWHGREKAELIRQAAARVVLHQVPTWGQVNNFHFVDRFLGSHRVGRLLGYNSRVCPMPGNHATPFQGHVFQTARRESTFAPSYHFVTDMGTDEAWTNLPGGPSENRFSKYYRSDLPLWLDGEYKRLTVHADPLDVTTSPPAMDWALPRSEEGERGAG
jgi:penicillin amidase